MIKQQPVPLIVLDHGRPPKVKLPAVADIHTLIIRCPAGKCHLGCHLIFLQIILE